MSIQNVNCWTHITALAYYKNHLLIGSGNKLEIQCLHSLSANLVKWFNFGYNIYRLKVDDYQGEIVIALSGNRFLTVLKLTSFTSLQDVQVVQYSKNMTDWILDISISNRDIICCLSSNSIAIFDWISGTLKRVISCPVKCIIYTGLIITCNSLDQILIATGNVFKKVIIWYSNGDDSDVVNYLSGHDGVIFALSFNMSLKLLCSASDDRSIRVWRYLCDIQGGLSCWKRGTFDIVHVFYSHESRIWSLICLNDCLISAGENDTICFWDHIKGTLIKKSTGKESSVWCITADEEGKSVYFGSSDGSIRCKLIKDEITKPKKFSYAFESTFAKDLKFLHSSNSEQLRLVSTLDNGCLSIFKLNENRLEQESSENLGETFKSYSVLETVGDKIFVGSRSGQVVKLNINGHLTKISAHNGKVLSYIHLNNQLMATCGPVGDIKIWKEDTLFRQHTLPVTKYRWPTCGLMLSNVIIFGDRNGHIYLFEDGLESKQMIKNVHSCNGVTDIKRRLDLNLIYSCGREGKIFEYLFDESQIYLRLLRALSIRANFDWIGGLIFNSITKELLFVIGFYSTRFVVWDEKEQSNLWSVVCGGGHRNWDFYCTPKTLNFCFIKKNEIFWLSKDYHLSTQSDVISLPLLIRDRYHASKINSCAVILSREDKVIFATSAEDNCIQISEFSSNNESIQFKANLSGHISSVKCIKSFHYDDKFILISAGGRSQLIIWQIEIFDQMILFKQLINHFLWNSDGRYRKAWKGISTSCTQVRYMCLEIEALDSNLLILVGCSDAFLRLFYFNLNSLKLQLLETIKSSGYCILSMAQFDSYYITGSTDGYLRFWSISKSNSTTIANDTSSPSDILNHLNISLLLLKQLNSHQSGINCIACRPLSDHEWLIGSSGDDASIHLFQINFHQDQMSISFVTKVSNAHYSLISGIIIINERLILTASIDQRIKLWNCYSNLEKQNFKLSEVQLIISCIADISCLQHLINRNNDQYVIVAGQGVQTLKVAFG